MTEEEQKAIDKIKLIVNECEEILQGYNEDRDLFDGDTPIPYNEYRILLNLIQKKQKEIEYWKNGFERELEDNRSNTTELLRQDLELRKKDKIIDLMSYVMTHEDIPQNEYCIFRDINCEVVGGNKECKECLKQYFENKIQDAK